METAAEHAEQNARARVLVAENIGEPGVALLAGQFEVDLGIGWTREEVVDRGGPPPIPGCVLMMWTRPPPEPDRAIRKKPAGRAAS